MEKKEIYELLTKAFGTNQVKQEEEMKKHTSFQIGGKADWYIKATTIEEVKTCLKIAKEQKIPFYVIGNGSNILVKDKGIRGIVLEIQLQDYEIEQQKEQVVVKVGAGVKLAFLAQLLCKKEITGFEFASGIPGTIGGAIRMNAGAHGREMKDVVLETIYLDEEGKKQKRTNQEQQFSYRHSIFCDTKEIIVGAVLRLQQGSKEEIQEKMQEYATYRKEKQPIEFPSAGSTFKRGEGYITAKLIDECGLKGYQIGGAKVAQKHAGFIINTGNATAQDVITLIQYVQNKIQEKYQKRIDLEIEIIGE